MLWLFIAVVVLGALALAMQLMGSSSSSSDTDAKFPGVTLTAMPVQNATETAFYYNLLKALPPGYLVFPQVSLGGLIKISAVDASSRTKAENRIFRKRVDFAVVRAADQICELVIELDGPDHQRKSQQKRDAVKDAALQLAGIKLLRLPAGNYSPADLRQRLTGQPASPAATQR